jgi:hypothetical protein
VFVKSGTLLVLFSLVSREQKSKILQFN